MRSIQYEKTEKTKGDAARRKIGIKESDKVGAKNRVFVVRGREIDEKTK